MTKTEHWEPNGDGSETLFINGRITPIIRWPAVTGSEEELIAAVQRNEVRDINYDPDTDTYAWVECAT